MKNKGLVLITLFSLSIHYVFADSSISRLWVGDPPPCPGATVSYAFDPDTDGVCDEIAWNVYYTVGTTKITVPHSRQFNGDQITVTWPSASAGYSGTVKVIGDLCCWWELGCSPRTATFNERLGISVLEIDGPELVSCGTTGDIVFDATPYVRGSWYVWSSDGLAGISTTATTPGPSSDHAVFVASAYSGNLPQTTTISVTAESACPTVPDVTATLVVTRSLPTPIPESPTITLTNYTVNSNKNGLNVMTIQGNQTVASGIKVNYRSNEQIRIIPSTVITAGGGVTLKIGLTCEFPTQGARIASEVEENLELDSVIVATDIEVGTFLEIFPNPSRGYSTIRFNVEKPGRTELYVSDITGKKISTLIEENDAASKGIQSLNYDIKNLKPGVYFCTLSSGSYREVKRFVVID